MSEKDRIHNHQWSVIIVKGKNALRPILDAKMETVPKYIACDKILRINDQVIVICMYACVWLTC